MISIFFHHIYCLTRHRRRILGKIQATRCRFSHLADKVFTIKPFVISISQYNNLDFEYLRQSHSKKYRHFYTLQPHARKYYLKHQLFVFLFPHYRGQPFHHISQGCLKTSTLTSHIYLHLFNSSNNQSYKSNFDWNFNRSGPIPFPRGGCVGRGPRPAVIRAGTRPR